MNFLQLQRLLYKRGVRNREYANRVLNPQTTIMDLYGRGKSSSPLSCKEYAIQISDYALISDTNCAKVSRQ